MKKPMKLMFVAALAFASITAVAAESNDALGSFKEHRYDYNFPAGSPTPFDAWQLGGAKADDAKAAEFAAEFAAKLVTVVSHVEDTPEGKRGFVIVADQRCVIDFVPVDKGYRVISSKCSTKPFGQF